MEGISSRHPPHYVEFQPRPISRMPEGLQMRIYWSFVRACSQRYPLEYSHMVSYPHASNLEI